MDNLELYNKVRAVPKEAQKNIEAGRLKGKTDINPMWRIKTLTEQFGVCGFGWKTEIVREWLEQGADGEVTANVEIKLYIKQNGEWSDAIVGIGGSALIAKERNGLYTDDDCYKKAYTDAISVACKALGVGADVYFEKDITKYDMRTQPQTHSPQTSAVVASGQPLMTEAQKRELKALGSDINNVAAYYKTTADKLTQLQAQQAIDMKKTRAVNGGAHG